MQHNTPHIMVVEPRGSGGMIHYAFQLCTALAKSHAKVTLVTSLDYEMDGFPHNFVVRKQMNLWSPTEKSLIDSRSSRFQRLTTETYRAARRAGRGVRYALEWIKLVKYIVQARPDVVQFGKIEFPFEVIFLRYLKRKHFLLSQICHEFELREQGQNLITTISNQMYRWVYQSFDILFFHGKSNQIRFLELFDAPQATKQIIEHGNEDLFLSIRPYEITPEKKRQQYGISPNAPLILFFGNLTPSKGLPDLIKSFSTVTQHLPESRLLIAGKPSKFIDVAELQKTAESLGIEQNVIFDTQYIPMEDVGSLMEIASVVVYPYLSSTQSGALQVAYTFGKPVIVTDVGGLPEAVEDGKNGFIVPVANPDELGKAMIKVINNPALAKAMGQRSRKLAETRFSWDAIAGDIVSSYIKKLS